MLLMLLVVWRCALLRRRGVCLSCAAAEARQVRPDRRVSRAREESRVRREMWVVLVPLVPLAHRASRVLKDRRDRQVAKVSTARLARWDRQVAKVTPAPRAYKAPRDLRALPERVARLVWQAILVRLVPAESLVLPAP